jgi:hypothetical protein
MELPHCEWKWFVSEHKEEVERERARVDITRKESKAKYKESE